MALPRIGAPAPDFALVAAGSGREVSLAGCAGRYLVLVFHAQNATLAVERMNRRIRESYPSAEEVVVASVADLGLVPPPFLPMAQTALASSYRQAARRLPPGADPAEYVVILGDLTGRVTRLYGAVSSYLSPVAVVVGLDGAVCRRAFGPDLAGAVLKLLEGRKSP